jgi:hypothetical protein
MLYSLLLWMRRFSVRKWARFISVLLFSLNRSLWSLFCLILVKRVIWLLLWLAIILVRFVHDHHILIWSHPVHLVFVSLHVFLVSVSQVVVIVNLTSILLPVLTHSRFIHEHYVTIRVVYIREKVGAVWLKWHDLLVIKQRIFVEVWTVEALRLFIWYIVSSCLGCWLARTRVVRCMLVHKVVRFLMVVLAIVDIGWDIF